MNKIQKKKKKNENSFAFIVVVAIIVIFILSTIYTLFTNTILKDGKCI